MDWEAIALTVRLSACTAFILLTLGLPVAHWLATTRWRGRIFVEALIALPLVLPPTVLGFYLLVMLGPRSSFGHWFGALTDRSIPFSFPGLLVGSVLYSLPFALQPFTAAFRSVDRALVEAGANLGATPFRAFRRISIPLAWPGLLAGMVLSFAHTLGEFGVVLMIGGNIRGETRTVSIAIYDQVQSLDYAGAAQNSLFLLVISFAILSVTYGLQRNFRIVGPRHL
ncbi:MAG TPA: molybdate ABC transporter permease subunit [Chthoniobacteraceae bacterium]|jgi:molybdate transport system permease protein